MIRQSLPNVFIASSILFISEAFSESAAVLLKETRVSINPCEFSDPNYAFGVTACVWRELPLSMSSRFNNRFKELVGLDDDGVFDLLCKSIDFQGELLVEAFANEYAQESEQNKFLETVVKCHLEVLARGNIQADKQAKTGIRKYPKEIPSTHAKKITTQMAR